MGIILLTKSKKYNNYCVTGIDEDTGNWIRLVSEDASIHYAVTAEDMTYEDNTEAQILDIVNVTIKNHSPNYYQPENYTYDSSYWWEKTGQANMQDVLIDIRQYNDNYIFHNNQKKLAQDFALSLNQIQQYSLKLIVPDDVRINVKCWDGNDTLSISACFSYNGIDYNFFKVTDEQFNAQFTEEGWYDLNNVALVISLADLYDKDNCHYKLIASVIDI